MLWQREVPLKEFMEQGQAGPDWKYALTAQACPSLSPCPASLEIINPRSCFDQPADVLEHLELNQSSKKLVFAKKLLK